MTIYKSNFMFKIKKTKLNFAKTNSIKSILITNPLKKY